VTRLAQYHHKCRSLLEECSTSSEDHFHAPSDRTRLRKGSDEEVVKLPRRLMEEVLIFKQSLSGRLSQRVFVELAWLE